MNDILVLTIDNDAFQRQLIDMLLSADRYRLEGISTAQEAFLFLQRETPDIMLIEAELPDMKGADLCSRIKSIQRLHHIPVILLAPTGQLARENALAPAVGADLVLEKPLGDKQLRQHVQELLKKHADIPSLANLAEASNPKPAAKLSLSSEEQYKHMLAQNRISSEEQKESTAIQEAKPTFMNRLPSINLLPPQLLPKTAGKQAFEHKEPAKQDATPQPEKTVAEQESVAIEASDLTSHSLQEEAREIKAISEKPVPTQFETVSMGKDHKDPNVQAETPTFTAPSDAFNAIEFESAQEVKPGQAIEELPSDPASIEVHKPLDALEISSSDSQSQSESELKPIPSPVQPIEYSEPQEDSHEPRLLVTSKARFPEEDARIVPLSQSPFKKEKTYTNRKSVTSEPIRHPLAEEQKPGTFKSKEQQTDHKKETLSELGLLRQHVEQLLDENQQLKEAIREFKSGVPVISSQSYLNAVEELEALRRLTEFQENQIKEFYKQNEWIKQSQITEARVSSRKKDESKTVWNRIVGGI